MTFNEINFLRDYSTLGITDASDLTKQNQAIYHLLLGSAKGVEIGHAINPEFKIGLMIANILFYPETCNPNDSIRVMELERGFRISITMSNVVALIPTINSKNWKESM